MNAPDGSDPKLLVVPSPCRPADSPHMHCPNLSASPAVTSAMPSYAPGLRGAVRRAAGDTGRGRQWGRGEGGGEAEPGLGGGGQGGSQRDPPLPHQAEQLGPCRRSSGCDRCRPAPGHSTAHYSTAQHSTSTVQYSTVQEVHHLKSGSEHNIALTVSGKYETDYIPLFRRKVPMISQDFCV